MLLTVSVHTTMLVVISVVLVSLYMLAISQIWGVEFNLMSSITLSYALGISLDYSLHIVHAYLTTKVPEMASLSDSDIRDFKARKALSSMGPSVIHGGISTLISISVLSQAQLYNCNLTFKCWSLIVVFGLANGLVLVPVMLSLVGPLSFGSKTSSEEMEGDGQALESEQGVYNKAGESESS